MNLGAWLRQDHSLADQLKVIEGLCRALNEAHERGVIHRALDPSNVEVESDGRCQLDNATSGSAAAAYRAPELSEGGSLSPQSDIYAAGVICYEMLSGRTPSGERPTPLADLRPDVSRDLTDAVMGCLEKGPDWRPKDLSYLMEVVGSLRAAGAKGGGRATRSAEPARSAPRASAAPARRAPSRGGSKSNLPLLAVVAVLALAAAAGYWFYFKQPQPQGETQVATRPEPTATATPTPVAEATPTPAVVAVATPKAAESTKTAAATPTPAATPVPTPTPRIATAATPEPVATPPPVVTAAATPPPTPPPTAPAAPAVLSTVSPLTVKRGGTTMLDLRGSGLHAEQQARIIKVKENTDGISIQRQKFMDPTLVKVLISLDPNVPPGAYAIALSDPAGGLTNTLAFTVVK
jgi:hypothetical protein